MNNLTAERRAPANLWRRVLVSMVVVFAGLGGVLATASPASADSGRSVCLWIYAHDGVVDSQHQARGCPVGDYHIHYWQAGGGWNVNGRTYHFPGRTVFGRIAAPVPQGATVCAELWHHGGGSWGLPCVTMS